MEAEKMLTAAEVNKFVACLRTLSIDDETLAGQLDRIGDDAAISDKLRSDASAGAVVAAFFRKIG